MFATFLLATSSAISTGGLCATSGGCSVHKIDSRGCQCNFHCAAHKDCCSDFAAVCPNQTDPCLEHKCKGVAAPTPITDASKVKAKTNATAAGKGSGGSSSSKAAGKATGGGKEDKPPKEDKSPKGEETSKKGHHTATTTAAKGSGGASGKASGSSSSTSGKASGEKSHGDKEHGDKEHSSEKAHEKEHEKEHEHGEHEHAEHAHDHPGHRGSMSWVVVLLACATGLTIPITVSIILILRARGVCCAPKGGAHQRIDKPGGPPTVAAADTVASTRPPSGELAAVPEGVEGAVEDAVSQKCCTRPSLLAPSRRRPRSACRRL